MWWSRRLDISDIHGIARHPRDLVHHRCIGWRPSPSAAPYRWEFEEDGISFDVAVEPQITTNDLYLMIRTALAGGGITCALEETFRPYIARGELVTTLDEYLPAFPGFFLYFPNRRNMAPKLRALIDHVRAYRSTQPYHSWRQLAGASCRTPIDPSAFQSAPPQPGTVRAGRRTCRERPLSLRKTRLFRASSKPSLDPTVSAYPRSS